MNHPNLGDQYLIWLQFQRLLRYTQPLVWYRANNILCPFPSAFFQQFFASNFEWFLHWLVFLPLVKAQSKEYMQRSLIFSCSSTNRYVVFHVFGYIRTDRKCCNAK